MVKTRVLLPQNARKVITIGIILVCHTKYMGSIPFFFDNSLRPFSLKLLMFLSLYTQRHAFHLVDPSIMPLLSSFSAFVLTTGSVLFFHGYWLGFSITIFGVITVLCSMFL